MVPGWMLSFPLLWSCLVDVPALLQEEHGGQGIDSAKGRRARLGIVTDYIRQQSQQQGKARRPLRSRECMLRFPICPISS